MCVFTFLSICGHDNQILCQNRGLDKMAGLRHNILPKTFHQPDFSLPLPPEKHRKTMLNHCKSLIFSKLRGWVRLQIPGDKNGLRVVSVTPYFINTNKASAIGPSGLSVDAFLCRFASLRGTKQSRPSTFSWIASSFLLAMTRSAYGGEALKS
jgi:hypothetical protein